VRPEGLCQYDTIGNRTRDLPACSAVSQPTAPLPAPHLYMCKLIYVEFIAMCSLNDLGNVLTEYQKIKLMYRKVS
jgi:hypothetical protein